MRVLLAEDLPGQLKIELAGHQAATVTELGWSGTPDAMLLRMAASHGFVALLTGDRNLVHQQPVTRSGIAVVVLAVPDNRLATIRSLVPELLETLDRTLQPGSITTVGRWRVG